MHVKAQSGLFLNFCCLLLPSVSNLQAELNSILTLRKQLERDVLTYRNLQKTLEEQISEIRRREGTRSCIYFPLVFPLGRLGLDSKAVLNSIRTGVTHRISSAGPFLWGCQCFLSQSVAALQSGRLSEWSEFHRALLWDCFPPPLLGSVALGTSSSR